jgi:hypothetical protein
MSAVVRINKFKGLFSSTRLDWRTPKEVYDLLNAEFNFDFDPCPPNPTFDGLSVAWGQRNFINPPYGKETIKWLRKGYEEHSKGRLCVFLVASRTDTAWWHDYVLKADEIRFIQGRLKFDGGKGSAPFPSAIVVFSGCEASP